MRAFWQRQALHCSLKRKEKSQGKSGGKRRLEVPHSFLSPQLAELQRELPTLWQGTTGDAHTLLCGPASVFTT